VVLSVPALAQTDVILTQLLGYTQVQEAQLPDERTAYIYETAGGGPGRELWLIEEPSAGMSWLGAGGVHHVAFRVANQEEQHYWRERISGAGLNISPVIDRYYFQSIYFRISNGILFEIATDGPGFATDEALDSLGETLALPPFLEDQREQIEAGLKPIEVVRS
jgi:glyoxalase family protein